MRAELPNLELIQERFYNHIKPELGELGKCPMFEVTVFRQMWEYTSLGFAIIGVQKISFAYTTVIWEKRTSAYGVFFGERLAYVIKNPNDVFMESLNSHRMFERSRSGAYRREAIE